MNLIKHLHHPVRSTNITNATLIRLTNTFPAFQTQNLLQQRQKKSVKRQQGVVWVGFIIEVVTWGCSSGDQAAM